jgi:hypothetical protein
MELMSGLPLFEEAIPEATRFRGRNTLRLQRLLKLVPGFRCVSRVAALHRRAAGTVAHTAPFDLPNSETGVCSDRHNCA